MRLVYLVVVMIMLLSGCGTSKQLLKSGTVVKELSEKDKFNFSYNLYDGNKFYLNGEYDQATNAFLACLKIDSTSSVAYYKLASIFLISKDLVLAEQYAKKAVMFNSENVWYQYLLGNLYAENKKFDEAIYVYKNLLKSNKNEIDYYLKLADIQMKANYLKQSLKTLNDIEKQFGVSDMISLEKHKIYLHQKKYKEALNELIILSEAFPKEPSYKRLIAEFYFKSNKIDEAILIYKKNIEDNAFDGYSHMGLAECYFTKGNKKDAIRELKLAFSSVEITSEIKVGLLVNLMQGISEDPVLETAVYELTEILVKKYPNDPDVNTIYADFLLKNNLLKDARVYLRKVINVRKDKYLVWEQLLLIENQFQDWNALYNESTEALEYFPNQSFLYFFNGFSAFQLNKYEEALKSFEFGFKLITKDDPLRKDYMTFLGECYYKLDKKSDAFKIFDDLLKEDVENVMVLNNYAYYLSLENKDLKRAAEMSLKTIIAEPNNPTYLDTYAWILFMQKNYKEALIYIEKTIQFDLDPSDVVIEHYGDILFFNDRIEDSIIQWNKAKLKGEGSGYLDEKIKQKKYIK
ncbi:MAG: tetratricopeptide repeat protein [Salinivirgaceae bacterium]|nr:tetratricopeptide repeat protein [Salinivirgaceae bacterium]